MVMDGVCVIVFVVCVGVVVNGFVVLIGVIFINEVVYCFLIVGNYFECVIEGVGNWLVDFGVFWNDCSWRFWIDYWFLGYD